MRKIQTVGGGATNRNSIKTYHEFAGTMPISFAPGVAAELRRESLMKKKAIEAKARQARFNARMRQDTTPGDRVVDGDN